VNLTLAKQKECLLMNISDLFLDKSNGLSRIETFGASLGTVHDGVTTVQLK
jgi:hypothetical protein